MTNTPFKITEADVGKRFRLRGGGVAEVTGLAAGAYYPFNGVVTGKPNSWLQDGSYLVREAYHDFDIIARVPEKDEGPSGGVAEKARGLSVLARAASTLLDPPQELSVAESSEATSFNGDPNNIQPSVSIPQSFIGAAGMKFKSQEPTLTASDGKEYPALWFGQQQRFADHSPPSVEINVYDDGLSAGGRFRWDHGTLLEWDHTLGRFHDLTDEMIEEYPTSWTIAPTKPIQEPQAKPPEVCGLSDIPAALERLPLIVKHLEEDDCPTGSLLYYGLLLSRAHNHILSQAKGEGS